MHRLNEFLGSQASGSAGSCRQGGWCLVGRAGATCLIHVSASSWPSSTSETSPASRSFLLDSVSGLVWPAPVCSPGATLVEVTAQSSQCSGTFLCSPLRDLLLCWLFFSLYRNSFKRKDLFWPWFQGLSGHHSREWWWWQIRSVCGSRGMRPRSLRLDSSGSRDKGTEIGSYCSY